MGFYNVQQGDVPYFKNLADTYSMSDNFHQSVMGGTGANHVMLGTGDAIWFSDGNGNPRTPPHNQMVAAGSPNAGVVDEVENPNPLKNTNNWYKQDGYGGGSYGGSQYSSSSTGEEGSLRLKIKPRDAQVFVDGYYVGIVDDFDGVFQRVHLPSGPHRIEVRAPGYETLTFDVQIRFDETTKFEGDLQRIR